MKQWMHTRPIRVFGTLVALSLVLTACDPQSVMQLLDAQPVAQEAPAAAGDDAAAEESGGGEAKAEHKAAGERKHRAEDADDATAKRRTKRRQRTERESADEAPAKPSGGERAGSGSAGGSANLSGVEQKIHELLNQTRRSSGLKPLAASAAVSNGARSWSCQMAQSGNFRHADLSSAGVNGENIAWGQQGAAAVHDAWMNSPGHRSNRMNSRWSEYGVGVCEDSNGRPYYTERFR